MFRNRAVEVGGSLFCQFISIPRPQIRAPITMETIMWGNWHHSTLENSLEYIRGSEGPNLLTFNLTLFSTGCFFTSGPVLRISGMFNLKLEVKKKKSCWQPSFGLTNKLCQMTCHHSRSGSSPPLFFYFFIFFETLYFSVQKSRSFTSSCFSLYFLSFFFFLNNSLLCFRGNKSNRKYSSGVVIVQSSRNEMICRVFFS